MTWAKGPSDLLAMTKAKGSDHIPTEQPLRVYDALVAAGADLGLGHAGYVALNTLRLEAGYRDLGSDAIPNLPHDLPTIRDMDAHVYAKADAGKLLVGFFEANASRGA